MSEATYCNADGGGGVEYPLYATPDPSCKWEGAVYPGENGQKQQINKCSETKATKNRAEAP